MAEDHIIIEQSRALHGTVELAGAKNAVLVIMASLILTDGVSVLLNVPANEDVLQMIKLLRDLGAVVTFDADLHRLEVDTRLITKFSVRSDVMKKMRASVLVMGPLLARFGRADIALPGGCVIGARPIDYHINGFKRMGVEVDIEGEFLTAHVDTLKANKIVLEYPSVGATENLMMAAALTKGVTRILNAALEPEVIDLMNILKKMGANIVIEPPATIVIEGVETLQPVEHAVIFDRLEAGSLLLAAAMTGGTIDMPQAPAFAMDMFLLKLEEMGHHITTGVDGVGVSLRATRNPKAVSFKTAPYPGFPTDLQAPMLAAQCVASGTSTVYETVYENRLSHITELQKMGAQIKVEYNKATILGVEKLYGASVIAPDIRASCALVIAGLVAHGITRMSGIHHLARGYEAMPQKLQKLGANIWYETQLPPEVRLRMPAKQLI
jgi:UDP-N-acetylglucosamine 1-carboxyvinyltransferase